MSGLVTYDSSSDEESVHNHVDDDQVGVGSRSRIKDDGQEPINSAEPLSVIDDREIIANDVRGGAVLGPNRPEGLFSSLDETSEQDLIRHLTQATHPMSSIPDSPPGSPDPTANARIQRFLELKERGIHFNEDLANKPSFRNPSLLSTMMVRAGIEGAAQYNTSIQTTLWDPLNFPVWAYKEELFKSQQDMRETRESSKKLLSAAGKRTIEFTSASNSAVSSRSSTPGQQNKRRKPG